MKDLINDLEEILHNKWEKGIAKNLIIGIDPEDSKKYYITTPERLRDNVIYMQNLLYDLYKNSEDFKNES